MNKTWVTGSGRQVYYQAGIIQRQHKKLDASIKKNQVKCRHISQSYLSAHPSITQLFPFLNDT